MLKSIKIIFVIFCLIISQSFAATDDSKEVKEEKKVNKLQEAKAAKERKFNIQQAIGSFLLLMPDIKIDIKFSDRISAGPILSYLGTQSRYTGYAIGGRINYFFGRGKIMNNDGMIINSYFLYHDHDPNGNFEIGPFKIRQAKGVSEYGVLLGYQWMEENLGYNIRFSVGVKHINKEFILIDNKKSKYLPNAQLTVGYAF